LGFVRVRHKRLADPAAFRSRRAFAAFTRSLNSLGSNPVGREETYAAILDAIRGYFGDKLKIEGRALTFGEVQGRLNDRGIDPELIRRLGQVFDACEAGRYGGSVGPEGAPDELLTEVRSVVQALDRTL